LRLDPASFQEIPLRQLLRRGSGSAGQKTTSAETVRFEDLHLGISWLGIWKFAATQHQLQYVDLDRHCLAMRFARQRRFTLLQTCQNIQ
jgi:hypothetical protein